ncbi:hyaluronan-mediated motility receptor-like [Melanaphis sacchari]|uniref:hyaluronan-mediated motility receptor-like n=1 Tax=Melanaphis sacchari TaxID=742174 RepID=UPI000DC13B2E|nr:hyaluronan-mediated motility receptor-like [Melanaphis sacchari]
MDNENEILHCKIKQLETYIGELETMLCEHEDTISKLDNKLFVAIEALDSIKEQQTEMCTELVNKNEELVNDYETIHTRWLYNQEENECLRAKNEQIHTLLEEQEAKLEDLEKVKSTHLKEIKKLKNQLLNITNKFQDDRRLMKSELKLKDQEIICLQQTLADKITQYAELEKKMSTEQDRNESLQSSNEELRIKYDKDVSALQAEMDGLRGELKQNFTKLETVERQLQEARDETIKRTTEFQEKNQEISDALCREKDKLEKKNGKLKAENTSLISTLACVNTKLCNSQMEYNSLKRQLTEQNESIKLLETTKYRLQQEIERNKKNEELIAKIVITEREQHDREKKISEKKLELKSQEERELKELSKKLSERIMCLKKMNYDCNVFEK